MSTVEGAGNIVTNGLVLCLDAANPKSIISGNTTWNDLTTNFNNATLINGPTYSSTNGGNIVFDGVDDYGDFGTNLPINGLSSVTFCVWVRATANSQRLTLTRYNSFVSPNNIDYVGFNAGTSNPRIICLLGRASNYTQWLGSTDTITINTWKYIVFVVNNPSSDVIGYVDGNSVSLTQTTVGAGAGSTINPTSSISWNLASIIGGTGNRAYYNTNMAVLQIYNRALSANEVLQNYNATKGRFGL